MGEKSLCQCLCTICKKLDTVIQLENQILNALDCKCKCEDDNEECGGNPILPILENLKTENKE